MRHSMICWIWLISGLSIAAEARPERAEVDGKEGYISSGKWYRLLQPADMQETRLSLKGCVMGKAAEMQGDVLRLYPPWDKLPCKLSAAITRRPNEGENLWLGGEIRGEGSQRVFQVEALAVLPGDMVLAEERWQEAEQKAQPDLFFRLAWNLEQSERFSTPGSSAESERRHEMIRRCYRRGSELAEKGLKEADASSLAKLLASCRQAAQRSEAEGNERWYAEACQELLEINAEAAKALAGAGRCDDQQQRQLVAGLYILLAKTKLHLLQDTEDAKRLLAAASTLAPAYPGLAEQMRRLSQAGGTKTEMTQKGDENKRSKPEEKKKATTEAAPGTTAKWLAAEAVEKKATVVEALLSQPTPANIAELARKLDALPLEIARYALWQAALLPRPEVALPLWQTALQGKEPVLRRDAAAILLCLGNADAQRMMVEAMAKEKNAAFLAWTFARIEGLPQAQARLDLLVQLLGSQAPRTTRQSAQMILEKETGQKLGLDHLKWQDWWQRKRMEIE